MIHFFLLVLLLVPQGGGDKNQKEQDPILSLKDRFEKLAEDRIYYRADFSEVLEEKDQYVFVMTGNFTLLGNDLRVFADNAAIWVDKKELERNRKKDKEEEENNKEGVPRQALKGLYADGSVTLLSGTETIKIERLFYDFTREKAIFKDAYLYKDFPIRRAQVPLYLRAKTIRQIAKGVYKAKEATITNCSFAEPHWYLKTERLDLWGTEEGATSFKTSAVTSYAHGIPFFWLPYFEGTFQRGEEFLLKSLLAGRSSKFGFYLLSKWGQKFNLFGVKDWGEWVLHLDEKTKRGPGVGLDLKYRVEEYSGKLLTYYQRDHGEDRNDFPFKSKDRGRIRLYHRHSLPFGIQADAEYQWISDANFMNEFFEDEFKQDKIPETYLLLKKNFDNHSIRLLERTRVNDFYSRVEYLPSLSYHLIHEPLFPRPVLGTNIYFSSSTDFSNVRNRPSELFGTGLENTRRIHRFDSENTFRLPLHLGPLTFSPFFGVRYSAFEETLMKKESDCRLAQSAGFRATTQLSKVYDIKNESLGLKGLRHIINPEVRFLNLFDLTDPPGELIPFDEVETVDRLALFRFTLRNRFQTKVTNEVFEFLDTDLSIDYFPFEKRDNKGKEWGNLRWDLQANFGRRSGVLLDTEFNFDIGKFDKLNIGTRFSPAEGFFVGLGQRILRDRSSTSFVSLTAMLTEKWSIQGIFSYDFETDRAMDHKFILRRLAHEWIFEIGFEVDRGENDTRVSFSVVPLSLFQARRKPLAYGEEPYLSRNLSGGYGGYDIYEEDWKEYND